MGARIVGRVNAVLCISMLVAYFYIVGVGMPAVKPHLLLHRDWSLSLFAIPLLLTSFSFQTMVPSLTPFLKRNPKALRYAVIGGTTIALLIYLIWEMLILGIIPVHGEGGIWLALDKGEPATSFLGEAVQNSWIGVVAEYFAFFALVTSFLGLGLGLFDFLADGLKIKKEGFGKLLLGFLIIVPTLFFAVYFERAFLVALDASGGFGDSILNGIIPVLMVWRGRYHEKLANGMRLPGGRPVLIALFLFFFSSLILEIFVHIKILPCIYS
jgi:tyrosine-specific transport protein